MSSVWIANSKFYGNVGRLKFPDHLSETVNEYPKQSYPQRRDKIIFKFLFFSNKRVSGLSFQKHVMIYSM